MKTILVMLAALVLVACSKPGDKIADWPIEWTYPNGSCQNTRTQVLVKQRANLIQWADPMSCTLKAGTWQSWGKDVQVSLGQAMVVPLVTPENAVESGAKNWTRKQQIAFINDKDNLIILDPVSVDERKNFGPDRWIPIARYRCEYGQRWDAVKNRYHLTISEPEKKAVAVLTSSCLGSAISRLQGTQPATSQPVPPPQVAPQK